MNEPTPTELEEYKALTRLDQEEIQRQLAASPHLSAFLKKAWAEAVKVSIDEMEADLKFENAAYHLFRIFRDERGLIQEIEDGLGRLEPLARQAKKLTSFRETPLRLPEESMEQINQIESAIFEILILRGLIRSCSDAGIKIELYPNVGSGKSNIEARLWIDGRWCNIEAKALGFTKSMNDAMGRSVGSFNIDSMTAPIVRALEEKAASGKQLACVPAGESAVVFLAQKGFLSREAACGVARDFLKSRGTPLSSVLVFGSFLCKTDPDLVTDAGVPVPLTQKEIQFFQGLHQFIGFWKRDYFPIAKHVLRVASAQVKACGAQPQTNLRERVTLFLVAKVVSTFESIILLVEHDRDLDAQILARSLLEAFAKARYIHISEDPETAAKEFLDFIWKKTAKAFNRAANYDEAFFKDFIEREDPNGAVRARTTKVVYWPENVTNIFKKITTEEVGALPHEWYDLFSDMVHSNGRVLIDYLDPKNNFAPFPSGTLTRSTSSAFLHPLFAVVMWAVLTLSKTFSRSEPTESHEIMELLRAVPAAPTRPIPR